MGIFAGLPVAVTSPAVFLALAILAVALFLLLNGRSVQLRAHSPLLIVLILAIAWFAPRVLYAFGPALPGQYASVMRVEESRKYSAGRSSRWLLSLRDGASIRTYDFLLSSPGEFHSVNLADVAAGSCLSVSAVKMPGIFAMYDASPASC